MAHSTAQSRILVFGTGSVGAVYTYILSKAVTASNVTAVCRGNYEIALRNGFTINSPVLGTNQNVKPVVVRSISEAVEHTVQNNLPPFDHVIVTTKILPSTFKSLPSQLAPVLSSPKTSIVLIQNGIAIEQPYRDTFPNNPIISCVVYLPVAQTSPAVVTHTTSLEMLHIGTFPSNSSNSTHKAAVANFASLLESAGAHYTVHEDIQRERWRKLVVNGAWNPVASLTRRRDVQFLNSSPHAETYIRDIMREIASIAQAEGYTSIDDAAIDHQIKTFKGKELPGIEPSTLSDVLNGRRLEVDSIVGNALEIARKHNLRTPLLRGIYMLLKALDDGIGEQS